MKPVSTKLKEQSTVMFVEAAGEAVRLCRGQLERGRMDINTTPQLSALEAQLPTSAVISLIKSEHRWSQHHLSPKITWVESGTVQTEAEFPLESASQGPHVQQTCTFSPQPRGILNVS